MKICILRLLELKEVVFTKVLLRFVYNFLSEYFEREIVFKINLRKKSRRF